MADTRLGILLRLYRAHRDQNVRDTAAEIGISAATLSRVERGHECDVDTLLKLLAWLREGVPRD